MRKPRFEIFQDGQREWRATFRAANGEPVWTTSEGYETRGDCVHAIELIKEFAGQAVVVNREPRA
jgi:uncharacterized protein YegP (UPF0339 family)